MNTNFNPFKNGPYSSAIPTSSEQERMISHFKEYPIEIGELIFRKELKRSGLESAISWLVQNKKKLKSEFSADGKFVLIRESMPVSVAEIDFSNSLGCHDRLIEYIQAERQEGFNLQTGPCFRFSLIKLNSDEHILLLSIHPILLQGESVQDLLKELENFYLSSIDDPALERMKKHWMRVLELNDILPSDNFFVLGGHSLLAVELSQALSEEFGTSVTFKDIFECPVLSELALRIAGVSEDKISPKNAPVPTKTLSGPVSLNQKQIWYIEKLFPDTRMHHLSTSLRIKWKLDPAILEKTIHYFIERHEALRTAIVTVEGDPIQKILEPQLPEFHPKLEVTKTTEAEVLDLMRRETAFPFQLGRAPLFRVKLYQLGPEDFSLFLVVHHAVWDGWCFDIFFEELNIIYSALEKNQRPKFKLNPMLRYLDHSIWMNQAFINGEFNAELQYWKQKLNGPLPILELPADFARPKVASHVGGNFRFKFTPEEVDLVKEYAGSKSASVFNVLLTAFKVVLCHYTEQSDIIVGSPIRGRNSLDILQTIGYFVNTLALRSEIYMDQSFEENLKRVNRTCVEAFTHQNLPFEVLLNEIDYQKDPGRTAIFQTFFTFQDMTNRQFFIDGRPVQQVSVNNASVKTDLDIWVKVTTSGMEGAIEYRADLFTHTTIEKFFQMFRQIIRTLNVSDSQGHIILPEIKKPIKLQNMPSNSQRALIRVWNPELETMRAMWKKVLGQEEILDTDNFFELGGHSLMAVKLFAMIEEKYFLHMRLSDLVQAPELEDFAELLMKLQRNASETKLVVPLRKTGNRSPVFFFHGVGGNILNYMPLVKHISLDRPVFALQSQGMDGKDPMHTSIPEMARAYVKELKQLFPMGPFTLIGGSMGGMVAYEVAQQLKAEGFKIEKLILLDTFGPNVNIQQYDKNERNFFKNLKISLFYRRKVWINKIRTKIHRILGAPLPLEIRLFDTEMNNYRALWKYKPAPYAGDLHLIRGRMRDIGWYSDPELGWGEVIQGEIYRYEIDGRHSQFIEAPQLAETLGELVH